jgi:hypothetical protein
LQDFLIALVGASAGWYLNHITMIASEDASQLESLIDEVNDCSVALEKYWLCKPSGLEEERALAAVVNARFAALAVFYDEASNLLSIKRLREYQLLQMRLFNEGTGGDFESQKRDLDPPRSIESYRISREIVREIRIGRRERLSPVYRLYNYFRNLTST